MRLFLSSLDLKAPVIDKINLPSQAEVGTIELMTVLAVDTTTLTVVVSILAVEV